MTHCRLLEEETNRLLEWCRDTLASSPASIQAIVRRLGAHPDSQGIAFGFWIPGSTKARPAPLLEIFTPLASIDFTLPDQTVLFHRTTIPLRGVADFWWGVVEGPLAGGSDASGSYYWVRQAGREGVRRDCLAYSLPFGSFAPAEVYDVRQVQSRRADREYFQQLASLRRAEGDQGAPRIVPPANILEIHVETATSDGTLAGLSRQIERISGKIANHQPLALSEELFCDYDAFELLPLEPVAEPAHPVPWRFLERPSQGDGPVEVQLRRPEISNWGYDTLIAGFPAVSPSLLASGRPEELVQLAETLHNFPGGPVKLILDVVLGHAHSQAEGLLDPVFFDGSNRYGRNLNYRHPIVRPILLEMLRRKLNWGADGLRVDASQDILVHDTESGQRVHDDEFLRQMSETVAVAAGVHYRPCMIFEDGRPWPRVDWKLTATYREVTRRQPESLQWSPLTFSSNEPLEPTFWIARKWRLDEIARHGSHWVTGIANHDTLRHATHLHPSLAEAWETPREAFQSVFNNPATGLLFSGFLPGVPMDFLNASREAPWMFTRNSDDHRLKTLCGEIGSLQWLIDDESFYNPGHFRRMKALGFADLRQLRRFAWALPRSAQLAEYEPEATVQHLRLVRPEFAVSLTAQDLDRFCGAWMEDWRDYCRPVVVECEPTPWDARFFHQLRRFRRDNPWLRNNLAHGDSFERLDQHPSSVVYRGHRTSPDRSQEILLLVNMAGEPATLKGAEIPTGEGGWTAELETPEIDFSGPESTTLDARHGLLFHRFPNRT